MHRNIQSLGQHEDATRELHDTATRLASVVECPLDCLGAVDLAIGEHGGGGGEHGAKKEEEGGKPPCGPKKKKVEVEAEFATTYYDFPGTFTANLKNSRHFIQVTIALSTQYDDQVITNVKTHEPALKGAVIATLADFTDQEIVGFEAKQIIAERIRDAINNVLVKKTRFGGIEEVVFTSFVTQ